MEQIPTDKDLAVLRLKAQLAQVAVARIATLDSPSAEQARTALRHWQAARLARTHAGLVGDPKYAAAARFFLADLYGPQGHAASEDSVRRILPLMKKTLPASALETIADAIELDALSESLDADMAKALDESAGAIDAAAYGAAYRRVGRRADRARQIDLIRQVGQALEQLTEARFVGVALMAMRKPAQAAGFGELQGFLERGYSAFRKMGGARIFTEMVTGREAAISAALFAGDDYSLSG
jgi:hypothetical protein